mmetsp:Transcript_6465/g.14889  ORF Transcript_6465/g.14889 Transcript_6465/m.14889 type:complete len:91 (-) Transcript_6465:50-322(-)
MGNQSTHELLFVTAQLLPLARVVRHIPPGQGVCTGHARVARGRVRGRCALGRRRNGRLQLLMVLRQHAAGKGERPGTLPPTLGNKGRAAA